MERHPGGAVDAERVARLLDRWGNWFVLSFRFLYGLRTISPVAIGLSSIPAAYRFTLLNAISAMVWAGVRDESQGFWASELSARKTMSYNAGGRKS